MYHEGCNAGFVGEGMELDLPKGVERELVAGGVCANCQGINDHHTSHHISFDLQTIFLHPFCRGCSVVFSPFDLRPFGSTYAITTATCLVASEIAFGRR